jgi:hypothetical protein
VKIYLSHDEIGVIINAICIASDRIDEELKKDHRSAKTREIVEESKTAHEKLRAYLNKVYEESQ